MNDRSEVSYDVFDLLLAWTAQWIKYQSWKCNIWVLNVENVLPFVWQLQMIYITSLLEETAGFVSREGSLLRPMWDWKEPPLLFVLSRRLCLTLVVLLSRRLCLTPVVWSILSMCASMCVLLWQVHNNLLYQIKMMMIRFSSKVSSISYQR